MSDAATTCPVDLEDGLARAGDDLDFYKELIEMFLSDAPERVETLRRCARDGDAAQLSAEAHGLKGAAASLSATEVRDLACEIESASRAGRSTGFDEDFDRLAHAIARLREYAEAL